MKRRSTVSQAVLLLILAAFVVLALAFSVVVPIFEAPDELDHANYVRFLRSEGRLPLQGETGEAHQPPLYYLPAALVSLPASVDEFGALDRQNPFRKWAGLGHQVYFFYHTAAELFPWQDAALAVHLMRVVSVLMGVGTVAVVFLAGSEIYPHRRAVPLSAAAIVAFSPQFVFTSGVVNNDNLANLCAAVALWMMVRLLIARTDRWTLVGLGLSLGMGLMAKQSLLVLLPVAAVVIFSASFRDRSVRLLLEAGLIVGGFVILLAGWWYVRNLALYGDLFGLDAFTENRPYERSATISNVGQLRVFVTNMHRSLWGVFGWGTLAMPGWFYWAMACLYLLAIAGWGMAWFRKRRGAAGSEGKKEGLTQAVGVLLVSLPLLYLAWVVAYGYRFGGSGWQGRYLFPAFPALALLLADGLANLFADRSRTLPLALVGLALLWATIYALFAVIQPAYSIVTRPQSDVESIPHPMDTNFGDLIRLRGYDLSLSGDGAEPQLTITFYWQAIGQPAEDYKVFVHLVDLDWEPYGQGDAYPVDGQFPTSSWREGDLVRDAHPVAFQQLPLASRYRIGMGWYLESTGERLSILQDGQEAGTVAETEPFEFQP